MHSNEILGNISNWKTKSFSIHSGVINSNFSWFLLTIDNIYDSCLLFKAEDMQAAGMQEGKCFNWSIIIEIKGLTTMVNPSRRRLVNK